MDWPSRYRVISAPGLGGSGDAHWQTFWEKAHPEIERVEQDDWDHPVREEWTARLRAVIAEGPDKDIILIGHSLGCGTIIHAAAAGLPANIKGAFLVALPDIERPDFPPECKGFSPMPRSPLPFPAVLIASEDDPYCGMEKSTEWAGILGARLINVGKKDHIGSDANLEYWEEGRELFSEFVDSLIKPD